MNKLGPLLPTAGLGGGICLCVLAVLVDGRAEPPRSPLQTSMLAPALIPVANPEPGTASVESPVEESTVPANDTEILASQGATFVAKDRIAVFNGDVRVKDPRFTLACDKLTAYLSKGAVPGAVSTPTSATPPPPLDPATKPGDEKSGDANRGGGIDRAVAEGHVIIIQKHAPTKAGEEEKVSIGRADIVEFDNKTGDMTLRGMPRVEQNGNSHEALSRSTVMVLHRDNSLDTRGPNRTLIVPRSKDNLPGSTPGGKPAGSPPAGTPAARRTQAAGT